MRLGEVAYVELDPTNQEIRRGYKTKIINEIFLLFRLFVSIFLSLYIYI